MSAPPGILAKVKKLLALSKSSNQNEAENARVMAEKLIEKHNITEQELSALDPKEYYGESEKLFFSIGMSSWRQQLAVGVASYFDCQIVQEMVVPAQGVEQYTYFVYGDDDQVKNVQFVYHAFAKKVNNLVDTRCLGRGPVYIESYCDGVVDSIKMNIQLYGIEVPEIKRPLKQEEKAAPPTSKTLVKSGPEKEEPTDQKIDINKGLLIKDIMAYFKGIDDGKNLSLQEILDLAEKNPTANEME